jgi:hypothetical protein
MKQIHLIVIITFCATSTFSQTNNPYAIFGHKNNVTYETLISDLLYIKNKDTSTNIKAIAFNIENSTVYLLGKNDSILDKIKISKEKFYRWLTVDPKANKRVELSPYNSMSNNPINRTDPTGALDGPYVDQGGNYLGNDGDTKDHDVRVINKSDWDKIPNKTTASNTDALKNKSTKLNEYPTGINITTQTWDKLRENGGRFIMPSVVNNSTNTANYKPEGTTQNVQDDGAYPVPPNSCIYMGVDGVSVPAIKTQAVFKAVDGQQIQINANSVSAVAIPTDEGGAVIISNFAQWYKGGWQTTPPAVNWNNLFQTSIR